MAKQRISSEQFIDKNELFGALREFDKLLKEIKDSSLGYQNAIAQGLSNIAQAKNKLNNEGKKVQSTLSTIDQSSKEGQAQAMELTKALMEQGEAYKNLNGAQKANQKTNEQVKDGVAALEAEYKALVKEAKNVNQETEQGRQAFLNLTKQTSSLKQQITDYNKELKTGVKTAEEADDSYNALVRRNKELIKTIKSSSGAFDGNNKALEALKKEYAENTKTLKDFDAELNQFFRNVGNYPDMTEQAIEANKKFDKTIEFLEGQIEGFGVPFSAFKEGFASLGDFIPTVKALFSSVKLGIASTGIGLLVIAFASLLTFFTKTQKGADLLAQAMAPIGVITDFLISAFADLGELIVDAFLNPIDAIQNVGVTLVKAFTNPIGLIQDVTGAVGEAGEEMIEASKRAIELTQRLIELEKSEIVNVVAVARATAELEKQKNIRDNEFKTLQERTKANEEAFQQQQKAFDIQIKQEQERLDILQAQFENTKENLRTREQEKEIAEQAAEVLTLQADKEGAINEQITNRVALRKEEIEAARDLAEINLDIELLEGRIAEGSREELDARKSLVDSKLDIELAGFIEEAGLRNRSREEQLKILSETNAAAKTLIQGANRDRLQLQKDFNDQALSDFQAAQQEIQAANEAQFNAEIALERSRIERKIELNNRLLDEEGPNSQILRENANLQVELARLDKEQGLRTAELAEERTLIEEQATNRILDINEALIDELSKLGVQRLENEVTDAEMRQEIAEMALNKNLGGLKEFGEKRLEEIAKQNELEIEAEEAKRERIDELIGTGAEFASEQAAKVFENRNEKLNLELEALQAKTEEELALFEGNEQKQAFIREEAAQKEAEIRQKITNNEKKAARAEALIQQGVAIAKAVASAPFPLNLPAIAFATIQSALQLANISKVQLPVPEFAEGTEFLELGPYRKGRDTIPAMTAKGNFLMLDEGERILSKEMNRRLGKVSNAELVDTYLTHQSLVAQYEAQKNDIRSLQKAQLEKEGAMQGAIMYQTKKIQEANSKELAKISIRYQKKGLSQGQELVNEVKGLRGDVRRKGSKFGEVRK